LGAVAVVSGGERVSRRGVGSVARSVDVRMGRPEVDLGPEGFACEGGSSAPGVGQFVHEVQSEASDSLRPIVVVGAGGRLGPTMIDTLHCVGDIG